MEQWELFNDMEKCYVLTLVTIILLLLNILFEKYEESCQDADIRAILRHREALRKGREARLAAKKQGDKGKAI
ncbi:MAG: hypothetical protein LBH28_02335 [Oscillospiraceae bacterium]|jgi:hypothetical protein|nr:hypothetical protein [Oscillospiraceae bacterium]